MLLNPIKVKTHVLNYLLYLHCFYEISTVRRAQPFCRFAFARFTFVRIQVRRFDWPHTRWPNI